MRSSKNTESKAKPVTSPSNEQLQRGDQQRTPRPGPAAVLAFLDIVLSGYLLYWAVFVLKNRALGILTHPPVLFAVFMPALFAWRAYYPTDPLTALLGRVARSAAALSLAALALSLALALRHEFQAFPAGEVIRAVATGGITSFICAQALRHVFQCLLFEPSPRSFCPSLKVPLWLGTIHLFGTLLIAFLVIAGSYSALIYGPRAGSSFLAVHAAVSPIAFAIESLALVLAVGGVPFLRWIVGTRERSVCPAVVPVILIGLSWGILGAAWGWRAYGFELFTYVVGLWLLANCMPAFLRWRKGSRA